MRVAFRNSVWAPVAFKIGGITLGMLALAGVGVASILSGVGAVDVPLARLLHSDVHGGWLASRAPARAGASASAVSVTAPPGSAAPEPAPATNASTVSNTERAPEPSPSTTTPAQAAPEVKPASGVTADGKVILNLATADELTRLPGVGKKRAAAIVALRTRLGRFKRSSDLLRVKGIGVRALQRILPVSVLDPPTPAA